MTLPVPFNQWQGLCDSWRLGLCVPETLRKTIQCIAHLLFSIPDSESSLGLHKLEVF